MIQLRGMTWDHPRGLDPLLASAEAFKTQGVEISWDARSLQGFEEASIAELAQHYDLIAIDHPFMGKAFDQQALQPVDAIVGADFVQALKRASVGPSFESYLWKGTLWAVPVDAAAQVAAFRADLLATHAQSAPRSWDDVFALARTLPPGVGIGIPANPTHILLAFATICHAVAADPSRQSDLRPTWWHDGGFDVEIGTVAMALLRRLMAVSHPLSWQSDPIAFFDHMVRHDDLVYTPIAFGYSNYARALAAGHPLSFSGVPSMDGAVGGGMLGGVGLAVSQRCTETDAVAKFLRFVAAESTQRGLYAEAGGQPADRAAWTDASVNTYCPHFFDTTLASLDRSFVRPRVSAYPAFQREGGMVLHALLNSGTTGDRDIIDALNTLWLTLQSPRS